MVLRLLAGSALVAGMVGMVGSTANAAPTKCQVKNLTTLVNYNGRLQSAIDAANNGDTIRVKGVCIGNFLIPGAGSVTNLTLVGQPGHKVRSTLDGNNSGTVLTVDFVTSSVNAAYRKLIMLRG